MLVFTLFFQISGYGDVYPETTGGRIFVVLFALLGIPVFMYMVASIGNIFCDKFFKIRNWFQRNLLKRAELTCPDVVCVVQCIIVTCLYVIIGGIIAAHVRGEISLLLSPLSKNLKDSNIRTLQ